MCMLILLVLSNHNFNETSVVLENTICFAIICLAAVLFPRGSLTILCDNIDIRSIYIICYLCDRESMFVHNIDNFEINVGRSLCCSVLDLMMMVMFIIVITANLIELKYQIQMQCSDSIITEIRWAHFAMQ